MKPEELKAKLNAVLIATLTPFNKGGDLDEDGLRSNIRFLVDKYSGQPLVLFPNASTGEFYAMSKEEQQKVISLVVEEVRGKLPVVVGAGHSGTKEALAMCRYAQDVGADGVIVILPYYYVPNQEGMYQHYKTIAEDINIGIIVYNNPDATKCYIDPALMARIVQLPGIVGIKENTNNFNAFYWMMRRVGGEVSILCGLGELWFAFEALMGCRGFVSGLANFLPQASLNLLKAASAQDFTQIQETLKKLEPLFDFQARVDETYGPTTTVLPKGYMAYYAWLSVFKAAMELKGLKGGKPRLPLVDISERQKEELKDILNRLSATFP